MIQISSGVCFLGAALLLTLPLDWVAALVFAGAVHELSHILALRGLGGHLGTIQVQTGGCILNAAGLREWEQAVSIVAGPCGSFSLVLLCRLAPRVAICGLIQGLYNLLPLLPLDGGRLLRLLLYRICPGRAERIQNLVAVGVCLLLDVLAVWMSIGRSAGIWPVILALFGNIRFLPRKIPCKPTQIGVQ